MFVHKRDGRQEKVMFDKITSRIQKLCYGLNTEFVDPAVITLKVISGLYPGVTTVELDNLAAETAATMTTKHPDYALLAARIAISNLHKETKKVFSDVMNDLFNWINPKTGKHSPMISPEIHKIIMENCDRLNSALIYDRDFSYNYFGFKTLERSYLLKINGRVAERPQHMLMRVSVGIHHHDIDAAIETYNLLSEKWFTHASPTLFNAGTCRPQLSSCFLLTMHSDSIEGIYDTLKQCALISKSAGGIGLNVHCIRATGSYIAGTNGISNGLLPMLRVYNNTARYVDQGGNKRPGAFAIYLEPWHSDVFDFLDCKKNTGKEESRARDLFYAMWIPDLFMKRVEKNEMWSLMCPCECPGLSDCWGEEFEKLYEKYEKEGKARKTVKAQQLWYAIIEAQTETGTPYMLFKDACNRKSNQQNLGTIKCSNLCTEIVEYSSPEELQGDEPMATPNTEMPPIDKGGPLIVEIDRAKTCTEGPPTDTDVTISDTNVNITHTKTEVSSTMMPSTEVPVSTNRSRVHLSKGGQLTLDKMLGISRGEQRFVDRYAELRRFGIKVFDQTDIAKQQPLKQKFLQFMNDESLRLLRSKKMSKAEIDAQAKMQWNLWGKKEALQTLGREAASSYSADVDKLFGDYKRQTEIKQTEILHLQKTIDEVSDALIERTRKGIISRAEKQTTTSLLKELEEKKERKVKELNLVTTNWGQRIRKVATSGPPNPRGRKRKQIIAFGREKEVQGTQTEDTDLEETKRESGESDENDTRNDTLSITSIDISSELTQQAAVEKESQVVEAEQKDEKENNTRKEITCRVELTQQTTIEEIEMEAIESEARIETEASESTNQEPEQDDANFPNEVAGQDVVFTPVNNLGLVKKVITTSQYSFSGVDEGSSSCVGISLLLAGNFFEGKFNLPSTCTDTDVMENVDMISFTQKFIPFYENVIKEGALYWKENDLPPMTASSAIQLPLLERFYLHVDTKDLFWNTRLGVGGEPASPCLYLVKQLLESGKKSSLLFTLSPGKSFIVLIDETGTMLLADSHIHFTNMKQSFEEARQATNTGSLILIGKHPESLVDYIFGRLPIDLRCNHHHGEVQVITTKERSENVLHPKSL